MGQTESKERKFFIDVVVCMLNKRGTKIPRGQIARFLHFVQEQCLWFPEEGTVNLETWNLVGKAIRKTYTKKGPVGVPANAFALWSLIRDALDPVPENLRIKEDEDTKDNKKEEVKDKDEIQPLISLASAPPPDYVNDALDPTDQADLDYEAARYPDDVLTPRAPSSKAFPAVSTKSRVLPKRKLVGPPPATLAYNQPSASRVRDALREGILAGDFEPKLCCPILYTDEFDTQVIWEALPYKILKELKQACAEYGPSAPYTQTLLDAIANKWMTPYDWYQVARTCLSGGNFLLWKSEYEYGAKRVADRYRDRNQSDTVNLDMLLGTGRYGSHQQLYLDKQALIEVTNCAINAWLSLPPSANKATPLTYIKQGSQEAYEDFVVRLIQTVKRVILNEEAADILTKQLAFENANEACRALLRLIGKEGTLNDFVKQCADFTPAFIQGVTMAAALKGESSLQCIQAMTQKPKNQNITCFSCGQVGHVSRNYPTERTAAISSDKVSDAQMIPQDKNVPQAPCPRCQKGFHWARECRSKYHKNGTLLPPTSQNITSQTGTTNETAVLGNRLQGPPRARTMMGINTLNPFLPPGQSSNFSEPLRGVQGWTSVPPPQQY